MKQTFWRLGWRTLWRDVRGGELRLLMVAVTLAVAAVTAVGFFADRLQSGLQRDARQLLGGDAVVASDNPSPPEILKKAQDLGLTQVGTQAFPTMARATEERGGASRLVALKAVQPGYPLRGTLMLQGSPDAKGVASEVAAQGVPAPGEAWVDPATLDALQLSLGDTLLLGDSRFRIGAVIALEPDKGAGFMNFAPRVMVQQGDVAATGLIQPASRVNYRLAVAGADAPVQQFVDWVEAQRTQAATRAEGAWRGLHVESMQSGRPEMKQTLERADKFLRLVALLAALLSAVAVALAARAFAAAHLDDCALLRVLGLSQRMIAAAYAVEFGLIGLFSSALGVLLGYLAHFLFVQMMAGLVQVALPPASAWPVALGLGQGMTLLLAFGLPPVLQLAHVPPLRVIRRDVGPLRPASLGVLALGVLGFAALLLVTSSDWQLGLISVGGFALAVLVFAALSWLAIRLLRRSVNETTAPRWLVLATRQVSAQPAYAVVQVSALALGMLALVLLVLLRTDLIASWRQSTPADAPNRFVINVMPDQGPAFRAALAQGGVAQFDWYPMMRGRLVAINQRPVSPQDYTQERAKRLVDREFNVSHSAQCPPHNEVVAGKWVEEEPDAISVEEGIATTLGLKLGDQLLFDMGGVQIASRITSLRKVDWSSMHVNFFVMYPQRVMTQVPTTFMAAFKAPVGHGFDNALVRQFPNVTSVDVSSTLNQLQRVLEQVIRAVEFLFGFTLVAGLVVLVAAVGATREERTRSYAIMRAVGAQGRLLRQVQGAELAGVGLLAGLLASLLATVVGWALAHFVFEFEWTLSVWVPIWGSLCGAVLALAAGWWGLRGILRRPVVETLRRASA
jgi:putative ABC transport system permease protein